MLSNSFSRRKFISNQKWICPIEGNLDSEALLLPLDTIFVSRFTVRIFYNSLVLQPARKRKGTPRRAEIKLNLTPRK